MARAWDPTPEALSDLKRDYYELRNLGGGSNAAVSLAVNKWEYSQARVLARKPRDIEIRRLLRVVKMARRDRVPPVGNQWEDQVFQGIPMGNPHSVFALKHATSVQEIPGETNDGQIFATSYDGVSLSELLTEAHRRKRVFPLGFVLHIARRLVRTVAYMHHGVRTPFGGNENWVGPRKICHMDIFEDNITIQKDDIGVTPILIDWGRAIVQGAARPFGGHLPDGAKEYDGLVDRRDDLMSIAEVLHKLLHGQDALLLHPGTGACDCSKEHLSQQHIRNDPLREEVDAFLHKFVRPLWQGPKDTITEERNPDGLNARNALAALYRLQDLFGAGFAKVEPDRELPRNMRAFFNKKYVDERLALSTVEQRFLGNRRPHTRAYHWAGGWDSGKIARKLPVKRRRGRDPMI